MVCLCLGATPPGNSVFFVAASISISWIFFFSSQARPSRPWKFRWLELNTIQSFFLTDFNSLTSLFLSSCSCGTREVFSYFSAIQIKVRLCLAATPPCNSVRFVAASISVSWTGWKLHSWALRIEYIFITKYITMAIKTINTRLIIPVVMASSFLPFRSLIVTVRTSNKNQKGFLSKKYVQNCFPPDESPVSDLTFPEIYSGFLGYYQWRGV